MAFFSHVGLRCSSLPANNSHQKNCRQQVIGVSGPAHWITGLLLHLVIVHSTEEGDFAVHHFEMVGVSCGVIFPGRGVGVFSVDEGEHILTVRHEAGWLEFGILGFGSKLFEKIANFRLPVEHAGFRGVQKWEGVAF